MNPTSQFCSLLIPRFPGQRRQGRQGFCHFGRDELRLRGILLLKSTNISSPLKKNLVLNACHPYVRLLCFHSRSTRQRQEPQGRVQTQPWHRTETKIVACVEHDLPPRFKNMNVFPKASLNAHLQLSRYLHGLSGYLTLFTEERAMVGYHGRADSWTSNIEVVINSPSGYF